MTEAELQAIIRVVTEVVIQETRPVFEANAQLRQEIAKLKMGIEMMAIIHKVPVPDGFW